MRCVVGLSGGVDSAVCASLLKDRGYEVTGVFLDQGTGDHAARETAESLGIGYLRVDVADRMRALVIEPFLRAWEKGETPNPCVMCNPTLKFKTLFDAAGTLGVDLVATGHYAVTKSGGLYKGLPGRDQSYMLYRLPREWLRRIVFPLGETDKDWTRARARKLGLEAANRKDSMDICFPYSLPEREWTLIDGAGKFLGRQRGFFTIGQRRGLGVASDGRLYVSAIDPKSGTVTLGGVESVKKTRLRIKDAHMLADAPDSKFECAVKIRHSGSATPASVTLYGDTCGEIEFASPVFGGASGQSAVFYKDNRVLGGGVICATCTPPE